MATSVGFQLEGGRIPGERIETTVETSDGSNIADTETTVASVTAAVVSGRTYKVTAHFDIVGTDNTDTYDIRIREDNVSGNQLQRRQLDIETSGTLSQGAASMHVEVEFTAGSTASKTFVLTFERSSGAGTMRIDAASGRPSYLYVDYIRG